MLIISTSNGNIFAHTATCAITSTGIAEPNLFTQFGAIAEDGWVPVAADLA